MVFDKTGSLAAMKRHDYLPFGEEISAFGGPTTAQGYNVPDGVRQQFTQKERDIETGLDYFGARYYGSTQGRFTSADPLIASAKRGSPQSWNRYTYCINNPIALVDPNGLDWGVAEWDDNGVHHIDYHYFDGDIGEFESHKYTAVNFGGNPYLSIDTTSQGTVIISNDPSHLRQVVPPLTLADVASGLGDFIFGVGNPGYDSEFANDYQSRMAGLDPQTGEPTSSAPMGGTLFVLPELPEGSFSILDWSEYPEGVPQPAGPFRLINGEEYANLVAAKNSANQAMHRADPELAGQHIHEIHPVKFGGSPTDPANKIPLAPEVHSRFTTWLNRLQRVLQGEAKTRMDPNSYVTGGLVLRPGAKQESIDHLMRQTGVLLPAEYVKFMLLSDGAEGPVGERGYLRLWLLQEIVQLNEGYHVNEFAPGLLLFGGDGGDIGYAFDTRYDTLPIVQVQLSDMSLESAQPFAASFEDFLKILSTN